MHGVGWLARTLNLLLMVKKNQGWRSVCLGRESGAPVRNAGRDAGGARPHFTFGLGLC